MILANEMCKKAIETIPISIKKTSVYDFIEDKENHMTGNIQVPPDINIWEAFVCLSSINS